MKKIAQFEKLPGFVQRAVRGRISNRMKASHFGQVVPIEDVEKIFEFTTSIVRLPCICRHIAFGHEHRFCYGISLAPDGGEMAGIIRKTDAGIALLPA